MPPEKTSLHALINRFEKQWSSGDKPSYEPFLAQAAESDRPALLAKFIEIEKQFRNSDSGDATRDNTDGGSSDLSSLLSVESQAGNTIGPYQLLEKIGEGGMGVVWKAQQNKPVKRLVALKLIKSGFASKRAIARFDSECQAVALMDDPHIAKVFDVGCLENGLPWFAMELIDGQPVTDYCKQHRLDVPQRLKLFVQICKAVQHAHQKGVIHRDLKPSNILVKHIEGQPVPKVIDFSLAKALKSHQALTDKTLKTERGQIVGTVRYMSPEQATLGSVDIDTRTDIYSLGVVLYQLLTGSLPIVQESFEESKVLEVLSLIRDSDPPTPSRRLKSLDKEARSICQNMQITSDKLLSILKGDLDWVVMRALEKDRSRRYGSANEFADDLQRYLRGDGVEARPPSSVYRFRKFVSKRKGLAAAGFAILTLLIAGITGTSLGMVRATREAARADQEFNQAVTEKQRADELARKAEVERVRADARAAEAIKQRKRAEFAVYAGKMNLASQAAINNEPARALDLLNEQIPDEGEEDLRGFEWHYLWDKIHPGFKMVVGHDSYISWGCDVSPDGKFLAFSGFNRKGRTPSCIDVFDLTSGELVNSLPVEDAVPATLCKFSNDGRHVCLAHVMTAAVAIVEFPSLKVVTKLSCDNVGVRTVCWSHNDESVFVAGDDARIVECDAETGKLLQDLSELSSDEGTTRGLHLSKDGKRLFASIHWRPTDNEVRTTEYDISGDQYAAIKSTTEGIVNDVSPDGLLGIGRDMTNNVRILDLAKLKLAKQFPDVLGRCFAFATDQNCFLAGSKDARLGAVHDLDSGKQILRVAHRGEVRQVGILPNNQGWFSLSQDGHVKIFDWRAVEHAKANEAWRDGDVIPNVKGTSLFSFAESEKVLVSNGTDCTVLSAEQSTTESLTTVGDVLATSRGQLAIACGKLDTELPTHVIALCDQTGKQVKSVPVQLPDEPRSQLHQVQLSNDNLWLVAKLYAGKFSQTVPRHRGKFLLIKNLSDAKAKDKVIDLGDCKDFKLSSDSKLLLACSASGFVGIWDLETGFLIDRLNGMYSASASQQLVAFSPNDKLAATAFEDGVVKVWQVVPPEKKPTRSVAKNVRDSEVDASESLVLFSGQTAKPSALAFFPDSKLLALACGKRIRLLDVERKQERVSLPTPGITESIVITKDGSTLMAVQDDGSVVYFRSNLKHCNWKQEPAGDGGIKE